MSSVKKNLFTIAFNHSATPEAIVLIKLQCKRVIFLTSVNHLFWWLDANTSFTIPLELRLVRRVGGEVRAWIWIRIGKGIEEIDLKGGKGMGLRALEFRVSAACNPNFHIQSVDFPILEQSLRLLFPTSPIFHIQIHSTPAQIQTKWQKKYIPKMDGYQN